MKKLAVFVSGSGSDLQSVIDGIESGMILNAKIELIVSSKHNVYALERAKKHNINAKVFAKADYDSIEAMFTDIKTNLNNLDIDYIVLAGYLSILPKSFVKAYPNKIINIHPSLIPNYCGDGYYGMKVHKAVIENHEKKSGATVHFVDEGTDTGAIIIQDSVEVKSDDTPETLQKRVLEVEHQILPYAVKLLTENKIAIVNGKVKIEK